MSLDIKRETTAHTPAPLAPPHPIHEVPKKQAESHQGKSMLGTTILIVLAAIVGGGSVYYGMKSTTEAETKELEKKIATLQRQLDQAVPQPQTVASTTPAPTVTPTPATTPKANQYDLATLKVGDKLVGMTVKSIEPHETGSKVSAINAKITFGGQATVTGKYTYHAEGILQDEVCLEPDAASIDKLPQMQGDSRTTKFCFSNKDSAHSKFTPQGSTGEATVVIDKYIDVHTATEASNTAELIRIVTKK